MKIKITMKKFKEMVNKVIAAVPKKPALPILSAVLIYTENGNIYMKATNVETELTVSTEKASPLDFDILEEIKCCIYAEDLKKIIKLKGTEVEIDFDEVQKKIVFIVGKKIITALGNQEVSNFPIMNYCLKETMYQTIQSDLLDIFERLKFYIKDNSSNSLNGYYCLNLKLKMFIAMDNCRIAMRKLNKGINEKAENKEILIVSSVYPVIKKSLNSKENKVTISHCTNNNGKKLVEIKGEDFILVSHCLEGSYYKIEKMLPSKENISHTVIINKKELEEATKYITSLRDKKDIRLMYLYNGKQLVSYFVKRKGEVVDNLETYENNLPENFIIGFNPQFLMDACKTVDTENLEISFVQSKKIYPAMIYGEKFDFAIMPFGFKDKNEKINSITKLLLQKTS